MSRKKRMDMRMMRNDKMPSNVVEKGGKGY